MSSQSVFDYKRETSRYKYYYQRLQVFYQKPIAKVSSAVLFTLATIIFFGIFAIRPTLETISELLRKIDDQKNILTMAEKKASALATAQQQLDTLQPHLALLDLAIPNNYRAQSLLKDIEATAGKLKIPISSLKVSSLVYPITPSNTGGVQEIEFTISLNAKYPLIKAFASELVHLPRMISIDSLTLNTPDDFTETNENELVGSMKCRAFYLSNSRGDL